MKKIATLFERDWDGDRSRVLPIPTPGCEWVFEGEGIATRKYDGMCCAVIRGDLYKRRELKGGESEPPGIFVGRDEETGKTTMWVLVGDGPEDRYFREAVSPDVPGAGEERTSIREWLLAFPDGTYELVGPKVQGNPERFDRHTLVRHVAIEGEKPGWIVEAEPIYGLEVCFDGLARALADLDVEGIVWHHPDGRMAKIKGRDFGIKRGERRPVMTDREALIALAVPEPEIVSDRRGRTDTESLMEWDAWNRKRIEALTYARGLAEARR